MIRSLARSCNGAFNAFQRRSIFIGCARLNEISGTMGTIGQYGRGTKTEVSEQIIISEQAKGFLELDLVVGKWTEENIHKLDDNELQSLVKVLDLENPDLWKWLSGQDEVPEDISTNPVFSSIKKQITHNLQSHTSSETRATPGIPWVRGWDDFKKTGPNNTHVGNQ